MIQLKLSSQLIGQFGHVIASASCKQPEKHGTAQGPGGGGGGGGYDKITCGAFLLSQQLFSPLTLYGNHFYQFISSLADLGAKLDRPGKIVPKKS